MKVKEIKTDVQKAGQIDSNKVSIKVENIDFITHILSTKLYSNPIKSFIRETVSNAYDSNVEAGNIDQPIVFEIGEDINGNIYCSIQDFGVGLSEERFNDIFINIGSSTKRETNDQIGYFGIGRFSALAVSDTVSIVSVYNGKKYNYLMYKDNLSMCIDKLNVTSTTDHNGLKVTVTIPEEDIIRYVNAFKSQLVYFENIIFVNKLTDTNSDFSILEDYAQSINNYKIKEYKYFKVNTLNNQSEINLLIGKIAYPLRFSSLNKKYSNDIMRLPISLSFNIGEIDMTPTREEILYNSNNIKSIEDKLDLALDELKILIDKQAHKDFDDPLIYSERLLKNNYIYLLDDGNTTVTVPIPRESIEYTLNGVKYTPDLVYNMKLYLDSRTIPALCRYNYNNGIIYTKNIKNTLGHLMRKDKFIEVLKVNKDEFKSKLKDYIKSIYSTENKFVYLLDDVSIRNNYKSIYRRYLTNYEKNYLRYISIDDSEEAAKNLFKLFFLKYVDMYNNFSSLGLKDISKEWLEDYKKSKKQKAKITKYSKKKNEMLIYFLRCNNYNNVTKDKEYYTLEQIANMKQRVVYAVEGDNEIKDFLVYLRNRKNYLFIQLAKTNAKKLKDLKNCVRYDDFLSSNERLIRNIGTTLYIKKKIPNLRYIYYFEQLKDISPTLYSNVVKLRNFTVDFGTIYNNAFDDVILEKCHKNNYFNFEFKAIADSIYKTIDKLYMIPYFGTRNVDDKALAYFIDYIVYRKILLVDYKKRKEFKQLIP